MKRKIGKMSMIMLASTLLAGAAPAMNAFAQINYNIDTTKTSEKYEELRAAARTSGDGYCEYIYNSLKGMQNYPELWNDLMEHIMTQLEVAINNGHIRLEDGSITCVDSGLELGTYTAPEVDEVIDRIRAIGTVTYTDECRDKIAQARSAYNALTSLETTLVTNYEVLTAAEREYAALKAEADEAAAAAVSAKISAIGTVAYTDECKARIDEARSAYDALTEDQQDLVTNYAVLTDAEDQYAALKAAADANEAAAAAVRAKISAIGTVAYTDECKAKIDEARSAYNALTGEQQDLVTNYEVLTAAEREYAALKAAADQAAADKAAADKAAADQAAADKAAADKAAADKNETQETAAAEPEIPAKAESIKGVIVSSAKAGNKKVTLKWNEVKGATSYTVYYSVCNGKAYKKKATVTGTQYVVKNLNNKKQYKFCIKANGADNTLSSTTCHVAMPKNKRTNPKSIKLNLKSATLKAGKTRTIKATIKKEKSGKKLIGHVAKVRYYSSDKAVAKVSTKGKITAVSKGTAVIYAVAENGLSQTVNVTVK